MKQIGAVVLTMLVALVFLSCGGGTSILQTIPPEGVSVSYAPSVGKDFHYKVNTDDITDVSMQGNSRSTHSKSVIDQTFRVEEESSAQEKVKYTWNDIQSGTFVNDQYQADKEESDIVGQSLTITVNRSDGKLVKWEGMDDLTYDENGMNQAEQMANVYAGIVFNYFPQEKIKVGSKWETANKMRIDLKEGAFMEMDTRKDYEVVDFVEKNGHKSVLCNIVISVDANSQNTGKDKDGVEYEIESTGKGKGKGKILFDFEQGVMVQSNFDWIVDNSTIATNTETGEKEDFTYYSESHHAYNLIEDAE